MSKLKVKHLLNHTVGFDQVLMMRGDIKDLNPCRLLDYTLNKDLKYKPSTYYLYSNAGFYILSATLQEYLQEDLINFIDHHLFSKLKIKNYKWEFYGKYLAGATRLWLFPEDLLKIGEVLLSLGFYQGKKNVSLDFIEFMKKILVLQNTTTTITYTIKDMPMAVDYG